MKSVLTAKLLNERQGKDSFLLRTPCASQAITHYTLRHVSDNQRSPRSRQGKAYKSAKHFLGLSHKQSSSQPQVQFLPPMGRSREDLGPKLLGLQL